MLTLKQAEGQSKRKGFRYCLHTLNFGKHDSMDFVSHVKKSINRKGS